MAHNKHVERWPDPQARQCRLTPGRPWNLLGRLNPPHWPEWARWPALGTWREANGAGSEPQPPVTGRDSLPGTSQTIPQNAVHPTVMANKTGYLN